MEQSRLNIAQILNKDNDYSDEIMKNVRNNLRVALPGIIQSFNPVEQTVTVQPTLREEIIKADQSTQVVQLPLLLDVPIYMPRGGNYVLTMPIKQGDECLVIFSDMCIDAWWSYGGIQNQIEKRRHDLSDAIALVGIWSQPNRINDYSINSVQLRNKTGTTYVEISDDDVNLVGKVNINGDDLDDKISSVQEKADEFLISAKEYADTIKPTVISQLENDVGYITATDIAKVNTYTHNQIVASSTWDIKHNLSRYPSSITIVDSAGNVVLGNIKNVSTNELTIGFTSPFSGSAYIS